MNVVVDNDDVVVDNDDVVVDNDDVVVVDNDDVGKQRMGDNLDNYTDEKDEVLDSLDNYSDQEDKLLDKLVGKEHFEDEDVDDELDPQAEDGLEGHDHKCFHLTWNHHINKNISVIFLDLNGVDNIVQRTLVVGYWSTQVIETFGVPYQNCNLDSFLTCCVDFKGIKGCFLMGIFFKKKYGMLCL